MRVAKMLMVVAAVGTAIAAAAAPPDAKPGLWERTVTRQMEGAPVAPVADRSKLTPEQRARIEQMMAMHGATAPSTAIVRYCVTAEAAQRWESFSREDGDETKCERRVEDESPRSLKVSLACADGKQNGTIVFTAPDPERVRGTITWVRQEPSGERKTRIDIDSRWLSSDCAGVKPGAPQRLKG